MGGKAPKLHAGCKKLLARAISSKLDPSYTHSISVYKTRTWLLTSVIHGRTPRPWCHLQILVPNNSLSSSHDLKGRRALMSLRPKRSVHANQSTHTQRAVNAVNRESGYSEKIDARISTTYCVNRERNSKLCELIRPRAERCSQKRRRAARTQIRLPA